MTDWRKAQSDLVYEAAREEVTEHDEWRYPSRNEYRPAFDSEFLNALKQPDSKKVLGQGQAHNLIYQQDYVYRLWYRRGTDGNLFEVEVYDGSGWVPYMWYTREGRHSILKGHYHR